MKPTSTFTPAPVKEPSPGITELVNTNPVQPNLSTEISLSNRRQYQLQRIPGFSGYGFSVNSNQPGQIAHKITQIAPNSPAAHQGKMKYEKKESSINFQILRSSCW